MKKQPEITEKQWRGPEDLARQSRGNWKNQLKRRKAPALSRRENGNLRERSEAAQQVEKGETCLRPISREKCC